MLPGIPRISIMVITYKQEAIVGRTLDSLIAQQDYLYEICVSDDCSPDGTWEVLLDYQRRYPNLIKLHRQEHNVGIFENTEYQWTMPTGDIINEIAGDDTTPDGWYKSVIDFIQEEKIDWKNELFCIYGDYKAVYPNGDSILFKNRAVEKRPDDVLRLALRGVIASRGCCFSKKVLERFENVSRGRSHKVEHAQDRQFQIHAEKNYYIPKLANVYYTGIGVSTHIQDEETYRDRLEIWPYTVDYLKSKDITLMKKDLYFGEYNIAMKKYRHKKSLSNFARVLWSYLMSRDYSLPSGNEFKHFVFAVIRRFPHNKPIQI